MTSSPAVAKVIVSQRVAGNATPERLLCNRFHDVEVARRAD
jgi:hypothetical protein